MYRFLRPIGIPAAVAAFSVLVSAQLVRPPSSLTNRLGRNFPPEIALDRFIDVVKIAPKYFSVDMENSEVRVVRAKLEGHVRIPLHDDRSGVIVALKDVHLRLTTPDGKSRDIHLKTGETKWLDGDAFSEQNLDSAPTEFLFIEHLRPKDANSDSPTGPIQ